MINENPEPVFPKPDSWPDDVTWPYDDEGNIIEDDEVEGGFPEGSERPTLEFPTFVNPGRDFASPRYRATELGELPAFYGTNQLPSGTREMPGGMVGPDPQTILDLSVSGRTNFSPDELSKFDLNNDGTIDSGDAVLAMRGEGTSERQSDSSMSKRRIDAKAQKAGASGQRRVQSAVDRALSYSFDDPNLQAASVGQTIAGQGAGLAGAQSVAGKQAVGEATREKGFEYAAAAKNYDAQVGTIMQQYKSDTDAAQRNFATLSGVFDMDMKSAWDEATWNHNTRVLEAQMNFEALFEVFLLSNVKMERIIHRTG